VVAGPATAIGDRNQEANDESEVLRANRRRARMVCLVPALVTGLVLGGITALVGLAVAGLVVLVVVTLLASLAVWAASPRLVTSALGGSPSDELDHQRLHNLVDGLCATLGLPGPVVVTVDSPLANAMAVGRDPDAAVLVVTTGLDSSLSLVELEAVLAHELVHIKRHDTAVSAPAVVIAALCSLLVGTTRATEIVHGLVGRGREFAADQRAAQVVRYPPGLEGALEAMVGTHGGGEWPPARGRVALLTRWLWVDPRPTGAIGAPDDSHQVGNLDDATVRAEALALR
jgi:Zn-dependent protease with chaperone function